MRRTILRGLVLLLALGFSSTLLAENQQDFGDYVVYYNAFTTDFLSPDVAKSYDITRSKNRGMLNISVQKKVMGTTGESVKAKVSGHARNLNNQLRNLDIRTIEDGNARYYIATFPVSNGETLNFDLSIRPAGGDQDLQVRFRQEFFTR